MFLGRYSFAVDSKGRVAIPSRFRAQLAGEVVLTRGIDRCLVLYPLPAWNSLAANVDALSIGDPNSRAFRRFVFAEAANLELDGQGRILLPAELRAYAAIDRDAVIIGVNSSVEIWNPESWRSQADLVERDGAELAARLSGLI